MKNSQIFKNVVLELDSKGYTREFIASELGIDLRQFVFYSTCMREPSDELVFKLLDRFNLLEKYGFIKDKEESVNIEIKEEPKKEEEVIIDVKEEPFIDIDKNPIEEIVIEPKKEEKEELEENDDLDIKLFIENYKSLTKEHKIIVADVVYSLLIKQRNDQKKKESEDVKHDSSTILNNNEEIKEDSKVVKHNSKGLRIKK